MPPTYEAGDRGEIRGKSPMPQRTKNVPGAARTNALKIDNRLLDIRNRTRSGQTKTRFTRRPEYRVLGIYDVKGSVPVFSENCTTEGRWGKKGGNTNSTKKQSIFDIINSQPPVMQ